MRRIHHLHLTAPTTPHLTRGQRLLEDAFRTASFPLAERSELVLIRQLNIGTIHPQQSATSVSLQLEAKLKQLSATAVPSTHTRAESANVVTFPDSLTAYSQFAYRQATGQSLQAWFWQKLLPNWQSHQPVRLSLQILFTELAKHPLGPLATAIVLKTLNEQSVLLPLLSHIAPEDGTFYLEILGWQSIDSLLPTRLSIKEVQSTAALSNLPRLDWDVREARSQWLLSLFLLAAAPTSIHPIIQLKEICQQIKENLVQNQSSVSQPQKLSPTVEISSNTIRNNKALDTKTSQSPTHNHLVTPELPTTELHTQYGGLGYLLNVLTAIDLPRYLPTYASSKTFPYHLLHYIAHRLLCDSTDPIFSLSPPTYLISDLDVVDDDQQNQLLFHAWYTAVRTFVRRQTALSLSEIVYHPAHFALTQSHLDLTFSLEQVDIRLRRTGLDLNPGWLPWFGRVVQFHYRANPLDTPSFGECS